MKYLDIFQLCFADLVFYTQLTILQGSHRHLDKLTD